jgi:hypothetical protein
MSTKPAEGGGGTWVRGREGGRRIMKARAYYYVCVSDCVRVCVKVKNRIESQQHLRLTTTTTTTTTTTKVEGKRTKNEKGAQIKEKEEEKRDQLQILKHTKAESHKDSRNRMRRLTIR